MTDPVSIWGGLLPKTETEALDFIATSPEWDGRGVIVGILDTGVDPGAPGLSKTSDGKVKVIDVVDCSGSGDVSMSAPVEANNGIIRGNLGRDIKINPNWVNPTGLYRIGHKRAYELFPRDLSKRVQEKQQKLSKEIKSEIEAKIMAESLNCTSEAMKEDLKLRLSMLNTANGDFEEIGPVYDCLVFHDGKYWQAVVDTTGTGDMSEVQPMTDYRIFHQYRRISEIDNMNYCVNIVDNGNILSIVTDCGAHGSHVAGIVSAYHPDQPECNGVAPGAQIVSLKIGDTRLGSMETGPSLIRALTEAQRRGCHIINISYGEAVALDNYGAFINLANELVYEHGIIIVSSAGNNGPALSTCGCPGGTTSSIIGVAALCTKSLMDVAYSYSSSLPNSNYTWSSVGPTIDGDLGVSIIAPGGAVTSVPNWTCNKKQLMNGTSMSSPNATGCISLLLSACVSSGISINPIRIRRSVENSASLLHGIDIPVQGNGLIQVSRAWELHNKLIDSSRCWIEVPVDVTVQGNRFSRGVYLRQPYETNVAQTFKVDITPRFNKVTSSEIKIAFEVRLKFVPTADWIVCNDHAVLLSQGKTISIVVDPLLLPPGLYSEFVRVYDADAFDLGPICSIPVTVTKPIILSPGTTEYSFGRLDFSAGCTNRTFLVPPSGCQYIDAIVRDTRDLISNDEGNDAQVTNSSVAGIVLHAVQLFSGVPFRDNEKDVSIALQPGSTHTVSWTVKDSWTMELVLARSWSTVIDTNCEVTLHFQGMEVVPMPIAVNGGRKISSMIKIFSHIRDVDIAPSGKLDRWLSTIKPNAVGSVAPLDERDILPDGKRIYQLVLEYEFQQTEEKKVSIVPRWPGLQGVLYESDIYGQLFYVYNTKTKAIVAVGDAWPSYTSLPKGEYLIRIQIRHPSVQVLESLNQLPVILDRKLLSNVSLSFYRTQSEALAALNNDSFKGLSLIKDGMTSCFIREPLSDQMPKGIKSGDVLVGSVNFMKKKDNVAGAGMKPGGYPISYTFVDTKVSAKTKQPSPSVDEGKPIDLNDTLKQAKIKYLQSLIGKEAFEAYYRGLVEEFGINNPLRQAFLNHGTNKYNLIIDQALSQPASFYRNLIALGNALETLGAFQGIVDIANEIIVSIDEDNIAKVLGIRVDVEDTKAVEAKANIDTEKSILIDALCLKSYALLRMMMIVTMDQPNDTIQIESATQRYQESVKHLRKWEDISTKDVCWELYLQKLRATSRLGAALARVNDLISANSATSPFIKMKLLIEEQQSLLLQLGWVHVIEGAKTVAALRQIEYYRPF